MGGMLVDEHQAVRSREDQIGTPGRTQVGQFGKNDGMNRCRGLWVGFRRLYLQGRLLRWAGGGLWRRKGEFCGTGMEVVALQGLTDSVFVGSRREVPLAGLGNGRLSCGKAGEGGEGRFDDETINLTGVLETDLHLGRMAVDVHKTGRTVDM